MWTNMMEKKTFHSFHYDPIGHNDLHTLFFCSYLHCDIDLQYNTNCPDMEKITEI